MGRLRSVENKNLPPYVMNRSGRFYLEPKGALSESLGGRKSIALGGSFSEMYMNYISTMNSISSKNVGRFNTMNDLIDRYLLEVTPIKAEEGQSREVRRAVLLKKVFGEMPPEMITTVDIYEFLDWRSEVAKVGVNRELSLLSSIFKKGVRWGALDVSPMVKFEYNKEKPRDRYISHSEYLAFQEYAFTKNPVVARYMDFKYVTGFRAADIRHLTISQIKEDGISLTIRKNKQKRIMEWSPALRLVTDNLIEACGREKIDSRGDVVRRRVSSEHVLFTKKGKPYTPDGWRSIFYKLMRSAVAEGVLKESFCDHDIRAKAGSDQDTVEDAMRFLAHLDVRVTQQHYRRKAEKIKPLI